MQTKVKNESYDEMLERIGWRCSNRWAHDMKSISGHSFGTDYSYSVCKDCGKTQEQINNLELCKQK